MEPKQTRKLFHSKPKTKWQPMDWEKIFENNATDKDLISNICKYLVELNNKKQTAQSKNR